MAFKSGVKFISDTEFELEIPTRSKTITLKLEEEEINWLDELAKRYGFPNRSELLRTAIIEFIRMKYGNRVK